MRIGRLPRALVALVIIPLLMADGCPEEKKSSDGKPAKAAPPPAAPPPAVGGDNVAPKVQDDPGNCSQAGQRDLTVHATYNAEQDVKPHIWYTKNKVEIPGSNIDHHKNGPGKIPWSGEWGAVVNVKCHDVIEVHLKGVEDIHSGCIVMVVDLGDGPIKTGGYKCDVTYLVP